MTKSIVPILENRGFASLLIPWYRTHGRDLPWRRTRDPYHVWLSEIMLQQTTVVAAIPYYQRFLKAFPDLASLANAPVEMVIELWAGLGYYTRARNLHRASQTLVASFGGRFPQTVSELSKLPGIGRSTAGAIVSIAFNQPAPILDGNVRRVLVRLYAYEGDPRSSSSERQLWAWAGSLIAEDCPHDYAQAIMDLGAMVCTPRDPTCTACPVVRFCHAHCLGVERHLPTKRQRKVVPLRRQVVLLVDEEGHYLVRRRPVEGFLGGLWEFPTIERLDEEQPRNAAERLAADLGLVGLRTSVGQLRHTYSHFAVDLDLFHLQKGMSSCEIHGQWQWRTLESLSTTPLHGAHRKALMLYLDALARRCNDE